MKSILLTLGLLWLAFAQPAHAQSVTPPPTYTPIDFTAPGLTLGEVTANIQSSLNPSDTFEGGGTDKLKFFKTFWQDRAVANGASGPDMFTQYHTALRTAVATRAASPCSGSGFQGNWQVVGPDSMPGLQDIGKINAIWADPADTTDSYLLAASTGGLFKTIDGGANWHCITDNAPIVAGVISLSKIAVNPLNKDTIFLGTNVIEEEGGGDNSTTGNSLGAGGFGAGILESFDGGNTWQQEFIPITHDYNDSIEDVQRVYFTPDGTRIYAFIDDSIYTRANAPIGPWQNITPPGNVFSATRWTDMQFVPGNQSHFFVSNLAAYSGVFESQAAVPDSADWQEISLSLDTTILATDTVSDTGYVRFAISVPNSDTLYAAGMSVTNEANSILYKYNITGTTHQWTRLAHPIITGGRASWVKMALVVSPANPQNIYYGGDVPAQSVDYGLTFTATGGYGAPNSHPDIRDMCLHKSTTSTHGINDVLFLANDGGVGKKPAGNDVTALGTNTVTDISGIGLTCAEVWSLGLSGSDNYMIMGQQHDGIMAYEKNAGTPWVNIDEQDASTSCFDDAHAQGVTFSGGPYITEPAYGRQLGALASDGYLPEGSTNFLQTLYIDPTGVQYAGLTRLWQLPVGASEWINYGAATGLPYFDYTIHSLCFSPYDTTLTGYVLFESNLDTQYFYYRNPAALFSNNFFPVSFPPGSPGSFPVTGVAMDPFSPQRIWASQGGITYDAAEPFQRVQYSPNAGGTWYDISYGLPPDIPVGKIVYDGGANRLFCATDVGIYTCDFSTFDSTATLAPRGVNTSVTWTCFNSRPDSTVLFPCSYITDLKINYCNNKLYAATFGRSVWSSDITDPTINIQPNVVDTITTTTTWNSSNQYITGSIYIQSGGTLNISGYDTVHMPKNGAIIVAPGGRLNVSQSMITNDCSQCFWQGISAISNGSTPQSPANSGVVSITNGSTIQHAVIGVANYDAAGADSLTTQGGIIQSSSSYYIDNQNAATLNYFSNYNAAGTLIPDLSYFHNCTFLIDNNYKGDALHIPMQYMVSLMQVNDIAFTGCQFLNRDTAAFSARMGVGIHTANASCNVLPYYTALSLTPHRSRFCGFVNGIEISGAASPDLTCSIDQADFDTVSTGVYISACNGVSTTRCGFIVGNGIAQQPLSGFITSHSSFQGCYQNIGIYVQNAIMFHMENNTFSGSTSTESSERYNIGTILSNDWLAESATTNPLANMVYLNTFDSLTEGVCSIGDNTENLGVAGPGLQIACNTFSGNNFDIFIANDGSVYPQGISSSQGSITLPSGNTFSGSLNNIVNNGAAIAYYYGSASGADPLIVSANVLPYGTTATNTCPSTFNLLGNPVLTSTAELAVVKSGFSTYRTAMNDSIGTYNGLMDLGNTDSLVSVIDTMSDTGKLHILLVRVSPYLSATALEAAADLQSLPYNSMVNVLLLNPDQLRNADFITYIQGDYALSTNDLATISTASATNTRLTWLQSSIQDNMALMSVEANTIMQAIKSPMDTAVSPTDTTSAGICTDSTSIYYSLDSNVAYFGIDSVDQWLQNIGGDWTWYARIGFYNGMQQFSVADSLYDSLAYIIGPKDYQDQYNSFSDLWAAISAQVAPSRFLQVNSERVFQIGRLSLFSGIIPTAASYSTGPITDNAASQMINNVSLVINHGIGFSDVCYLGDPRLRKSHKPPVQPPISNINDKGYAQLSVAPNPASNTVTFSWNESNPLGGINITVTNALGELVATLSSETNTGKITWNTSQQSAGVYIYQATDQNGIIGQGKLVIVR